MAGLTRRELIAAMVVAGAAVRPAAARLPSDPEVVIVGAGMAGLSAAHILMSAGIPVALLEARSRIGGRAFAENSSFGVPFDHGCARIGSADRNPLTKLATDLGFDTLRETGSVWTFAGSALDRRGSGGRLDAALGRLRATVEETGDAGRDVALTRVFSPADRWDRLAMAVVATLPHGVEAEDLSLVDAYERTDTGVTRLVPRGLGNLVAAYGDRMPVSLDTPVDAIDWRGQGVALQTPKGTIRAKAALITIPTGVLAAGLPRFDPPLPDWKQEAAAAVPMGLINRVALQYRREAFAAIGAEAGTWLHGWDGQERPASLQIDPFDGGMIVGQIGGTLAGDLERAGGHAAIDHARMLLRDALGSRFDQAFRRGLATAWASDPWSRGSASAVRPGLGRMRRVLGLPVGDRLYFAGEAVHPGWAGQLAGAHLSGLAVATRYLAERR